jgi:hypothetical protein
MSGVVPKKVIERFQKTLSRFQSVLKAARDRDINESDTVSIVGDIFGDVLGYDKYLELTGELAIRGTYCDLAIKIGDKVQLIIEVKAIGIDLKDSHMKQACDYGANHGVPWIVLTNGVDWRVYRIRFEQPIAFDMVYSFNAIELSLKNENDIDMLYILSKEGLEKNAREAFFEKSQSVNRFIVGNIILREEVLGTIRKELKKLTGGDIRIELPDIEQIIKTQVVKREILEGEEADAAKKRINKFYKKASAAKKPESAQLADKQKSVAEEPKEENGQGVDSKEEQ